MSLSHLNALRALEAAVRHGSFRAASEELGVTPAAVGQQVRKLEDALGRQLLIRHAKGFEPTQTARLVATRLAAGFAEVREALAMLAPDPGESRVFVTVTPSIAERWLAPRLTSFLAVHPEIDLRIDSTPYVHHDSTNEYDFAIRYDRPGRSGREETLLFGEVLIPVCTPEIAERIGPAARRDCLSAVPLLHVDRSTDDPAWFHWDEWGQYFGYDIPSGRQRVHFSFTTLVLRALYDGYGLHLAQLSITAPDLISGRLVAPFGTSSCVLPRYHYSLVRTGAGPESSLHRAFKDWIVVEGRKVQAEMEEYLASNR